MKESLYDLFMEDNFDVDEYIEEYIKLVSEASSSEENTSREAWLEKEISLIEKKKAKILEFNVLGKISDDDYITQNNMLNVEYRKKSEELSSVRAALNMRKRTEEDFEKLRETLKAIKERRNTDFVDSAFIKTYIEKIEVSMIDKNTVNLNVILNSGERISRILKKNLSSVYMPLRIYTGRRLVFQRKTPYGRGTYDIPIQINICFFSLM